MKDFFTNISWILFMVISWVYKLIAPFMPVAVICWVFIPSSVSTFWFGAITIIAYFIYQLISAISLIDAIINIFALVLTFIYPIPLLLSIPLYITVAITLFVNAIDYIAYKKH